MRLSRRRGQVTHVLLTRSPLIHTPQKGRRFTVRLACVKHAASVRPAPGSNSPNKTNKSSPNQPQTTASQNPKSVQQPRKPDHSPTQPPQQNEMRTRQTKTKQTPKTTHNQSHAQPQGNGIKNMTHYRVLKQHTQPGLDQVFRLNLALASNSATLEHLPVQRQPHEHCSRSHRSTFRRSRSATGRP